MQVNFNQLRNGVAQGAKSSKMFILHEGSGTITIQQLVLYKAPRYAKQVISAVAAYFVLIQISSFAQDGNAGINEATTQVKSYFDSGTTLMYAIGAVVGLIGAVKVYQKWNGGDPDTGRVAASWFGSCIFLVVVATVLRSFFGI